MRGLRLVATLLAASAITLCQTQTPSPHSVPVYLPDASFWTHAIPRDQGHSGNAALDEAYSKYLAGDLLSARAHLYKARAGLNRADLKLRALSLASLIDMGPVPNALLISWKPPASQVRAAASESLSDAWKKESGAAPDPSLAPWIDLFTAYQTYRSGARGAALEAWLALARRTSDSYVEGLALLAVVQLAGEGLSESVSRKQPHENAPGEILKAASLAVKSFTDAALPSGIAQAHLLAGQVAYLAGDPDAAWKELTAANDILADNPDAHSSDVEIAAVIGEYRKGNTPKAQDALEALESAGGAHRVPAERVRALVEFTRKVPAIINLDDPRPIHEKITAAREFYAWTASTRDPLLEIISLRTLSDLLQEGGYLSDAAFYSAVQKDLWDRYRSGVPFAIRVRRAAFLDYDFLRESKFLETHDPVPFRMTAIADAAVLAKKANISEEELRYVRMTRAQANARIEQSYAPVLKAAAEGDAAAAEFRARMKANDTAGARDSIGAMVSSWVKIMFYFNSFTPSKSQELSLNADRTVFAGGKSYEVHTHLVVNSIVEYRLETDLDWQHDLKYDMLMNQILGAAITGREGFVLGALKTIQEFYDRYRGELSPPDLLDVPFMLSGRGGTFALFDLKPAEKQRSQWVDKGVSAFGYDLMKTLQAEALKEDTAALAVVQDNDGKKQSEDAAVAFFKRNYQLDGDGVQVTAHQVHRTEQEPAYDPNVKLTTKPKTVINIEHAVKVNYEFKPDSVYRQAPKGLDGMDVEGRAALARRFWSSPPDSPDWPDAALAPRLDRILQQLHSAAQGETLMRSWLGTTATELANNIVQSPLIDAGQVALSAQASGDFLPRSGAHDLAYWRNLFRTDATARTWISTVTGLDPGADRLTQLTAARDRLQQSVEKLVSDDSNSDSLDQVPENLKPILHIAGVAQMLKYRPLAFLLVGDKAAAEEAARKIQATHKVNEIPTDSTAANTYLEDGLALGLYGLASGSYREAAECLAPLPDLLRRKDPARLFQAGYLLAMARRRAGDPAGEVAALSSAAADLDSLRAVLSTRNEAAGLDPVRQLIYEELIGTLMSRKQYDAALAAIGRYRRSTQIPVSVLRAASHPDPRFDSLLREVVFAYDVLSREDVWKVPDANLIAQLRQIAADSSQAANLGSARDVDPREFVAANLNHIADVLVDEIRIASAPASRTTSPHPDGLTISYFLGTRSLYRVAVGPSGMATGRVMPLPADGIAGDCDRFRAAIEERKDPATASARLYDNLLGDMPELKNFQRLYIAPDGPLNFIPFQALRPAPTAPYLIETHSVSYLTGANARQSAPNAGGRALLVGNPDGTLSAAEAEVSSIARIPELRSLDPLVGKRATLDNVRQQLPSAGLIHLATHARANPSYPGFAYLQLGDGDRLYSLDLGGLDFAGKSVFLSACETRIGQVTPGDDIYGLADSFLSAGASSVVSTLWRIESDSSAVFARRYYELFARSHDAPEALAATAREFIAQKYFVQSNGATTVLDAPLFWAGFNHLVPGATAQ